VARKVKKTAVSLSYSLQKLYTKISTARPSPFALAVIAMAIAVFLYGGGFQQSIMVGVFYLFIHSYPSSGFQTASLL